MSRIPRLPLAALALATLPACDDFVDPFEPVDLVGIHDPASAELMVNSAIAAFECGYSNFGWIALGHEDLAESIAGVAAGAHVYLGQAPEGACDTSSTSRGWFEAIMGARRLLTNADQTGVYDRLEGEWAGVPVPNRGRLSTIAAIYVAASLNHFGEFFCELALDGGPLMTPDDVLAEAERWTARALDHIDGLGFGGDFALPHGIAFSAEHMARALRARIRWARGDPAGALADAEAVPQGFTAWVTRGGDETRRNKIHHSATEVGFSQMLGVNDWWTGSANPATGQPWPSPIPFTGYLFLGVLPDGRTLEAGNLPVRWAEERRDAMDQPVPLANGAVPDIRVRHFVARTSGPSQRELPNRYGSSFDPIPLVSWREMWLIRAEVQGGQVAIDLVNDLRRDTGLPEVTYITGTAATSAEVRALVIEERRRALFAEGGRYWAAKIQNPDLLWFPRGEGRTTVQGFALQGGVRLTMPVAEYELNPHLTPADRGTGCDPLEAPVV